MNYLIHADSEALSRLETLLREICLKYQVQVGSIKATFILMELLDEGQERGLIEAIKAE